MRPVPTSEQIEKRFWKKVNKTDQCWLWTGGVFVSGYAAFWVTREGNYTGKNELGHRFVWELTHGPIPPRHDHRPPVSSPPLCQSFSHGSGHPCRQCAPGRFAQCDQRSKDALPQRSRVHLREHTDRFRHGMALLQVVCSRATATATAVQHLDLLVPDHPGHESDLAVPRVW